MQTIITYTKDSVGSTNILICQLSIKMGVLLLDGAGREDCKLTVGDDGGPFLLLAQHSHGEGLHVVVGPAQPAVGEGQL